MDRVEAGKPKPGGRYDKIPLNHKSNRAHDAHDPSIWLSFEGVTHAYASGKFSGIAFVLDGKPVCQDADGRNLYLVGIDIDECIQTNGDGGKIPSPDAKADWKELGKPYLELSPSWDWRQSIYAFQKAPDNAQQEQTRGLL